MIGSLAQKQMYLKEKIVDEGHDPEAFVYFCQTIKENGHDINIWTMDELILVFF